MLPADHQPLSGIIKPLAAVGTARTGSAFPSFGTRLHFHPTSWSGANSHGVVRVLMLRSCLLLVQVFKRSPGRTPQGLGTAELQESLC